jgi:hypothetical protein
VEDLLGVQKGPPLACSPPQTTRTAIRRLSVPKIELSVTPDDSPHRESASAHRREQLHQQHQQQQLERSAKASSGGSALRPTEDDDSNPSIHENNNNSKHVSQSSDGTTIVPPLVLGVSPFPVKIDDLEVSALVSGRSNRSTEVDSAEGCCSAELSANMVNVSEVEHNERAKKNTQIESVDNVDRRIEN